MVKIIDVDKDIKRGCISIITRMRLAEYKELAYESYEKNGNFEGQRGVIKKSSAAARIRKRMKEDFSKGAIFPQVVIGIECDIEPFLQMEIGKDYDVNKFLKSDISIIDGMQRSNVYFESYKGNENREIRVEFWIAKSSIQLLYRMLVLNTGQTPWNTRRQIEVIYSNLAKSIEKELFENYPELKTKIEILGIDDNRIRRSAGKYHKVAVIETYLGFNTRSVKINMTDELSEEYQRFDMMESIEQNENFQYFVRCFGLMCKMDLAFAKYESDMTEQVQFVSGKDLFGSIPVCIGFIVACAEYVLGKVSVERSLEQKNKKLEQLKCQVEKIIKKIADEELSNENFVALDVLNGICENLPKARIGDEMRRLFKNIFMSMLKYEEFEEIVSLEDFWKE